MRRAVACKYAADQAGATAAEYLILVAFLALVIITGVGAFGTQLGSLYTDASEAIPSESGGDSNGGGSADGQGDETDT